MEAEGIGWTVAIAILVSASVAGRFLDALLHATWVPRFRDWLYEKAIWFDTLSYAEMLHGDTQKARRVFDRFFGKGRFSVQLAILSTLPIVGLLILAVSYPGRLTRPELIYFGVIVMINAIVDQFSLRITRSILRKVEARLVSLVSWGAFDVLLVLWLGPLPFTAVAIMGGGFEFSRIVLVFTEPLRWPLRLPFLYASEPLSAAGLVVVFLGAALPTLIHLILIAKDILLRAILKPLARRLSSLLEYIEREKNPMTWLGVTIGGLAVLVKAWKPVIEYLAS